MIVHIWIYIIFYIVKGGNFYCDDSTNSCLCHSDSCIKICDEVNECKHLAFHCSYHTTSCSILCSGPRSCFNSTFEFSALHATVQCNGTESCQHSSFECGFSLNGDSPRIFTSSLIDTVFTCDGTDENIGNIPHGQNTSISPAPTIPNNNTIIPSSNDPDQSTTNKNNHNDSDPSKPTQGTRSTVNGNEEQQSLMELGNNENTLWFITIMLISCISCCFLSLCCYVHYFEPKRQQSPEPEMEMADLEDIEIIHDDDDDDNHYGSTSNVDFDYPDDEIYDDDNYVGPQHDESEKYEADTSERLEHAVPVQPIKHQPVKPHPLNLQRRISEKKNHFGSTFWIIIKKALFDESINCGIIVVPDSQSMDTLLKSTFTDCQQCKVPLTLEFLKFYTQTNDLYILVQSGFIYAVEIDPEIFHKGDDQQSVYEMAKMNNYIVIDAHMRFTEKNNYSYIQIFVNQERIKTEEAFNEKLRKYGVEINEKKMEMTTTYAPQHSLELSGSYLQGLEESMEARNLANGLKYLQAQKEDMDHPEDVGATIVVIPYDQTLDDYKEYLGQYVEVNIDIHEKALLCIFTHKSVLHDGAIFVKGNRIIAVKSFFRITGKLKKNASIGHGTRHASAQEFSKKAMALKPITFVLSEEDGLIRSCINGKLNKITSENIPKLLIEQHHKHKILNMKRRNVNEKNEKKEDEYEEEGNSTRTVKTGETSLTESSDHMESIMRD